MWIIIVLGISGRTNFYERWLSQYPWYVSSTRFMTLEDTMEEANGNKIERGEKESSRGLMTKFYPVQKNFQTYTNGVFM